MENHTTHKIEFWLEPVISRDRHKLDEKYYFVGYANLEGDTHRELMDAADDFLKNSYIVQEIMDDYCWSLNNDWGILNVTFGSYDRREKAYDDDVSPDEKIRQGELQKFSENIATLQIDKKDILFNEGTSTYDITLPAFKKPIKIPIHVLYDIIKLKTKNVDMTLTNSFGDHIVKLVHGSFLNVGLADIKVYKKGTKSEDISIWTEADYLEGGIFLREGGRLDIGNIKRTKYLQVDLAALLKELHLKGALEDAKKYLESVKLLPLPSKTIE